MDAGLPGMAIGLGPGLALASRSACGFTSLLVLGKKLSALLLRKLLVLKESDRFSFWSLDSRLLVDAGEGGCSVPVREKRKKRVEGGEDDV